MESSVWMNQDEISIREEQWKDRIGVFRRPPTRIPTDTWTDAPLLGNGDIGVSIGGEAHHQTFYIGKNDFWVQPHLGESEEQRIGRLLRDNGRRTGARIITVGQISLLMPGLTDASYDLEQDILNAETRGSFRNEQVNLRLCSWVSADSNVLVTELECMAGKLDVTARLHAGDSATDEVYHYDNGADPEAIWFRYAANAGSLPQVRRVAAACRVIGTNAQNKWLFQNVEASFQIRAGERLAVVTAIVSNRDEPDCLQGALGLLNDYATGGLDGLAKRKQNHRGWWREYWRASSIEIGDPVLEKYYYASYYIIGSCMRPDKVQPGLFGNWVTTDRPKWTGSYTMNYNFEAPYFGLYTGNRIALSSGYCDPLLAFLPLGKVLAREKLSCRGIYMPVELGPDGMVCSALFHGQKSNASFAAVNLLMHIYYTYDLDYARKVYPYLLAVADFWEDYLVFENGRYVIYDDDIHERSQDRKNPILSLGFVRMIMRAMLHLSVELDRDTHRQPKWRHILANLSAYPLMERSGKTVYRLTEEGMSWNDRNSLAVQHIFPAGNLGLDSSPEELKIAQDTVAEMQRWSDFNAFPTYYAAAARVGHDPAELLERLRAECERYALPNLSIHHGGGGIEDAAGVPACLHEMLLQSHQGILRLFPTWPADRTARFKKLRAVGAFVVSSEIENGKVRYVLITSERGRELKLLNPWPDRGVIVYRDGAEGQAIAGERIQLETMPGERLLLLPG
ncbi:glycosyl hydrolase family 95 catalytic domain-containing protein [Paenibacillus sp. FSL R5-0810]|uniref:glycosyl hydrolase family 95 catalytic domain-containing protein n=1 Tax=Paenibacillus sp. FSL R5-0810 TaxID=2921659 RepID=UPI0030F55590